MFQTTNQLWCLRVAQAWGKCAYQRSQNMNDGIESNRVRHLWFYHVYMFYGWYTQSQYRWFSIASITGRIPYTKVFSKQSWSDERFTSSASAGPMFHRNHLSDIFRGIYPSNPMKMLTFNNVNPGLISPRGCFNYLGAYRLSIIISDYHRLPLFGEYAPN